MQNLFDFTIPLCDVSHRYVHEALKYLRARLVRIFRCIIIVLLLLPSFANGQTWSTVRRKTIALNADTLVYDSLSTDPGSLRFPKGFPDSASYVHDALRSRFIRKKGSAATHDSLVLEYRVLRISLAREYRNKDRRYALPEDRGVYNPLLYSPNSRDKNTPTLSGLNKSGSISRGISVGNAQDLSVNSTLNLQLTGKLSPEIDVNAAITDDNIPIQPEGNTQQLQDFDKVYIQLSGKDHQLTAGDFQITRPESYFLNFNKRLQGLNYKTTQKVALFENAPEATVKAGGSIAVARGRFNRNTIQAVEGNQGPYRLRGVNNEQFIIILSGSEKVYIDGRLLRRGQENDYIIDYNSAEIIFTSRILMTKDLRIFVEFEYSDRNYARSLYHVQTEVEQGRLTTRLNVFSEQDSRNQPLQQQLTDALKLSLRNAGDTLSKALVDAVDSVGWVADVILYRMVDTLVNGQTYSGVLVYSTDPAVAVYRAGFSQVGSGKGNYVQENSTANGKVYRWVAPVNGVPQGSFEPKMQLIPPSRKRIVSLGADYKLGKNLKLSAEGAFSENDVNTFSDLDAFDNQGYAFRLALENSWKLSSDSLPWTLTGTFSYEQVDKYFSPQERFRNVEFDRDWNLQKLSTDKRDEFLPRFNLRLARAGVGSVNYLATAFVRVQDFRAMQHALQADLRKGKHHLVYQGSVTSTDGSATGALFYRHKGLFTRDIWKLQLGYRDELEHNLLRDLSEDTLVPSSYAFFDRQVFLQNSDTTKNAFQVFYRMRTDDGLRNRDLTEYAKAESYGLRLDLNQYEAVQLRLITTVRNLFISDTVLSSLKPEQSLVNRVELNVRGLKNSLSSSTYYETGSGLESRKAFSYLEVQPGQGVFSWVDYNGNGIKELNEFEVAVFADQAKYIRVYTPTNDFIRVYATQFNQVFNLKSPAAWNKVKGWKKWVSRLAVQSAWRMDSRTSSDDRWKAYNPLRAGFDDPELITLNRSLRNSAFINRSDPKFGMDFNWQQVSSRVLQNNGLERREHRFGNHRVRWSPGSKHTFSLEYREGEKRSAAEFFTNRDYQLRYAEWEPKWSYQPNAVFRFSLSYKYAEKRNEPTLGGEYVFSNTAGLELKYNQADKGSFQARLNAILIQFSGAQNSPVAFEMQEGLRSGNNYTWGLSYQRTLSNNMQLNLNYDGRKSPDVPVVHVGGVQVRLFF